LDKVSWQRNLLAEGIEPNPGPRTFVEYVEAVKGRYKGISEIDELLKDLEAEAKRRSGKKVASMSVIKGILEEGKHKLLEGWEDEIATLLEEIDGTPNVKGNN
jgi:hypothetical protein